MFSFLSLWPTAPARPIPSPDRILPCHKLDNTVLAPVIPTRRFVEDVAALVAVENRGPSLHCLRYQRPLTAPPIPSGIGVGSDHRPISAALAAFSATSRVASDEYFL